MRCLVLGATGYVGTRLVERLIADGHQVRCLVRDLERTPVSGWGHQVELIVGDVSDRRCLDRACRRTDALYFLVHSMEGPGFVEQERRMAIAVAASASRHQVSRIVYLSGLQPPVGEPVSPHLASRREVGELLLASGVPTVVLQAGVVLGSGSSGFEMARHLAESLPVLPTPGRVDSRVQPIGIDDALHFLVASLSLPADTNRTFDIGAPDVVSYRELSARYAASAGLTTHVTVPVPEVPARWVARVVEVLTPVDRHLAAALLESMSHDLVCQESDLEAQVGAPPGGPTTVDDALRRAIDEVGAAGTRASDAAGSGPTVLHSEHVLDVAAPAERVWQVLGSMGGRQGWNTIPGVWAARGWVDGLLGGVGNRQARPAGLAPGQAWDSWRIESVEPGSALTLRSEMRLPGIALLQMSIHHLDGARSRYEQRVSFQPTGLIGRAYWYAQLPAHQVVFGVMAGTIKWRAEQGLPRTVAQATVSAPVDDRPRS